MNANRAPRDARHASDEVRPGGFRRMLLLLLAVLLCPWSELRSAESVRLVDVLGLFTRAAAVEAGDGTTLREAIRVAVLNANLVLQNSQARLRFCLVGVAPVDYAESGSLTNDVARLRTPGDGVLDQAFQLRDATAADLVFLVTATGDLPKVGAPGPSAANAFSVIRYANLMDLAGALGRNFGCQPDRATASGQPSLPFAYGYGFDSPSGRWGTAESSEAQRLTSFSNPNLAYDGVALGVPAGTFGAADNAQALSLIAPLVAAFRGPAPETLPQEVRLVSPTNGSFVATGALVRIEAVARDPDALHGLARPEFRPANAPCRCGLAGTVDRHLFCFADESKRSRLDDGLDRHPPDPRAGGGLAARELSADSVGGFTPQGPAERGVCAGHRGATGDGECDRISRTTVRAGRLRGYAGLDQLARGHSDVQSADPARRCFASVALPLLPGSADRSVKGHSLGRNPRGRLWLGGGGSAIGSGSVGAAAGVAPGAVSAGGSN